MMLAGGGGRGIWRNTRGRNKVFYFPPLPLRYGGREKGEDDQQPKERPMEERGEGRERKDTGSGRGGGGGRQGGNGVLKRN